MKEAATEEEEEVVAGRRKELIAVRKSSPFWRFPTLGPKNIYDGKVEKEEETSQKSLFVPQFSCPPIHLLLVIRCWLFSVLLLL